MLKPCLSWSLRESILVVVIAIWRRRLGSTESIESVGVRQVSDRMRVAENRRSTRVGNVDRERDASPKVLGHFLTCNLNHDVDRTEDSLYNAQLWLRSETLKTSIASYAGGWANAESSELVKMDRLRKRDRGKRWLKDTFTFSRSLSPAPSHPNLSVPHTPHSTHQPNTKPGDAQEPQADVTSTIVPSPESDLVAQPQPTWGRTAASPLPIIFATTGLPNLPGAQKIAAGTSASSADQQSLQSHVPGLPPIPVELGTGTTAQNCDVKQAAEGPVQHPSGRIIPFTDPSQVDINTDHQNIDNLPSEAIIKQQSPGRKFYEGMKTTLRTIERVSDVFPPLKSTAAALLVICETIDVCLRREPRGV
ncbi:hypothetical protein DFP72DRAFT_1040213 [Ephemerocybe angulata]|uniref:Uncharacterized protein n=1 Tax=Ephemerocybe angulata TaxID=980116 RepID=A0A8H6IIF9_9AGAR|nr:hypothetical protein DFP72DRAFT_1040213 [Tulosesus angulatus]